MLFPFTSIKFKFSLLAPDQKSPPALTANMFTFNNALKKDVLMFFCFIFFFGGGGGERQLKINSAYTKMFLCQRECSRSIRGFRKESGRNASFA